MKRADDIPEVKEWLSECRTLSTRRTYEARIRKFLEWYAKPFSEFLKLDAKAIRHLVLLYQQEHSSENPNSVYSVITAVSSLAIYLDKGFSLRGKKVKPRPDIDSHIFNNGDLTRIFDVANTKEKALLSLMTSTGWEIGAIMELKREFASKLIARAKAEGSQFIYFEDVRKKTGAKRFAALSPLALEWLSKWLTESASLKARKRKQDKIWKDRTISDIFDIGQEGVNKMLRRLAKDSGLVSTGRLHYHRIRSWVISNLSRAGWNEFQIRFLVGKSIPMTDSTYLNTLEEEIRERYPVTFQKYLNIKPEKVVTVVDANLEKKVAEQAEEIARLTESAKQMDKIIGELTRKYEPEPPEPDEIVLEDGRKLKRYKPKTLQEQITALQAEIAALKKEKR